MTRLLLLLVLYTGWVPEMAWSGHPFARYGWYDHRGRATPYTIEWSRYYLPPHIRELWPPQRIDPHQPGVDPHNL